MNTQNPQKRPLLVVLADWIASLFLEILKFEWEAEIWEPKK